MKFVSFIYDGGSNPGTRRFISVNDENNLYLTGKDLVSDEFRRFKHASIRGLISVQPKEVIDMKEFPPSFYWEDLAKAYRTDGYFTTYDSTDNILYVLEDKLGAIRDMKEVGPGLMQITGGKGEVIVDVLNGTATVKAHGVKQSPYKLFVPHNGMVPFAEYIRQFID